MIIVRNEKLVTRNKRIGNYSGFASLIILGLGMYISFQYREQVTFTFLALITGFLLSQVGVVFTNRFGRSPRPDEQLDAALKGLDDDYALYHYQSPVTHLLVGPAGIWVLYPYPQEGIITYNDRRRVWKKTGGNLFRRLFGQENIGRPDREIPRDLTRLKKNLEKIPELELPEVSAALVFTHPNSQVEVNNAPYLTLHARQLKKTLRKEAKSDFSPSMPSVKAIQDFLGLESIT
jgi:hypothetical protein